MNFHSGKEAGTTFEKLFERQCQLAGLWAEPNHIKAKRIWGGKLKELKSNLDYTVMRRGGSICFSDCKTFDGPYFTFSEIPDHQLELACRYNHFAIDAGFVVWFRPVNLVSFFSGWVIGERGRGQRFLPQDGILLGSWDRFRPELIFSCPSGSTTAKLL